MTYVPRILGGSHLLCANGDSTPRVLNWFESIHVRLLESVGTFLVNLNPLTLKLA